MKTKLNILAITILTACHVGFGQSTVQFRATTYTVAESAGSITLNVERSGDTGTAVGVDYATEDVSARNGLEYTAVSGTVAFAAGETNQPIVVPILNDGLREGTKAFRVNLSNPTNGAVLGARAAAIVPITDNDIGIQFQFANYSVAEDGGAVFLGIARADDGELPCTLDFATTDLTGTSGRDYIGTNTTLTFGPTERLKFVPIPILNNDLKEANRTFRATLSNPVGATLANQNTTTVTIEDNDQGFQFEAANCTVAEDAGVALIHVLRGTDATDSATTVDYVVSDVTARNSLDYVATNGTLFFGPGEKVKVLPIAILNDGVKETTETFRLTLSNPTGGAVLGSITSATVSILDNDPGVGFEVTTCSVWEKCGEINLTVVRGNDGGLGPFTVDYATADGSARAGQDYEGVSGTLEFADNEMLKSLTIPILADAVAESTETFQVRLSNPTGGTPLGITTATVGILENDYTLAPPFDSALAIRRDCGVNVLTWTGGGLLQRADRVTGPWETLGAATSPWVVQPPVPASFYRVAGPRPVTVFLPSSYEGQTPMPLVILLHGYSLSGDWQENYMHFQPLAESRGFLYCHPDGTVDRWGRRFWNAGDAGGDFGNTGVDDAGYLRALIEEIAKNLAVDRKRVYFVGHSNGGRMAYRMACESADLVAAIASLAGMPVLDASRCVPSEPVNILHIHGTDDGIDPYGGGALTTDNPLFHFPANMPASPGAERAIHNWAGYNGVSDPFTDLTPSLDLTTDVAGLDTVVTRYQTAPPGGAVELWTINGGEHIPTLSTQFSSKVIDWLLAHPKPSSSEPPTRGSEDRPLRCLLVVERKGTSI